MTTPTDIVSVSKENATVHTSLLFLWNKYFPDHNTSEQLSATISLVHIFTKEVFS